MVPFKFQVYKTQRRYSLKGRLVQAAPGGRKYILKCLRAEEAYLTLINTIDYAGQQYYILYDGVLDDIFDGDWICVYALPLGATTFENTEGGETWTIPMAGSYVEKINLDEPL